MEQYDFYKSMIIIIRTECLQKVGTRVKSQ